MRAAMLLEAELWNEVRSALGGRVAGEGGGHHWFGWRGRLQAGSPLLRARPRRCKYPLYSNIMTLARPLTKEREGCMV